jgi:hypothetical protein
MSTTSRLPAVIAHTHVPHSFPCAVLCSTPDRPSDGSSCKILAIAGSLFQAACSRQLMDRAGTTMQITQFNALINTLALHINNKLSVGCGGSKPVHVAVTCMSGGAAAHLGLQFVQEPADDPRLVDQRLIKSYTRQAAREQAVGISGLE